MCRKEQIRDAGTLRIFLLLDTDPSGRLTPFGPAHGHVAHSLVVRCGQVA